MPAAGESCHENAARLRPHKFLGYDFRSLESNGTFYGVLNAAGPALYTGPANLTFRRKEATDVNHHVDRYDRRYNGDHGDGPLTAAPSSEVQ